MSSPKSVERVTPEVRRAAKEAVAAKSTNTTVVRGVKLFNFRTKLKTARLGERVKIEREGVPHEIVQLLLKRTGVSSGEFIKIVNMPKATFTKKMRDQGRISGTPGQSVVGFLDLINQVEDMLAAEEDNPEAKGFDVEKWVGEWIQKPQPALGGIKPAELMDTPSGRESVKRVLGAIQSGAYQ